MKTKRAIIAAASYPSVYSHYRLMGKFLMARLKNQKRSIKMRKKGEVMEKIRKSIEVNVPLHIAYNQWTQFEEFPRFMEGIKEVKQIDDTKLHWRAEIMGREIEWDAKIIEQAPHRVISWESTTGARNSGTVSFESSGGDRTHIILDLEYEPRGAIERVNDIREAISNQVEGDLQRFKEFIEQRGTETGGWTGEIHKGKVGKNL